MIDHSIQPTMTARSLDARRKRYFRLATQLAQIESARLPERFAKREQAAGKGNHETIEVGGAKVFVKRLPLTTIERDNFLSTRNLYDLPPHYHYGVGSAGLGVWRELVCHLKTTHWVLDGQIETFPLLYHYRVLPFTGERAAVDLERHQWLVDYWGGDPNIDRYLLDRSGADHELILCFEHIPHVLHPWLVQHPDRVDSALDQLRHTLDFLRKRGIVHFDAHFHNVLTDGARIYLTDFGLALDRSFDLRDDERAFFRAHPHYDYSEALACLLHVLNDLYDALPADDRERIQAALGVPADVHWYVLVSLLVEIVESLPIDRRFAAAVARYRPVIARTNAFLAALRDNPKKDTRFRDAPLRRALHDSGFLPG